MYSDLGNSLVINKFTSRLRLKLCDGKYVPADADSEFSPLDAGFFLLDLQSQKLVSK